VSRRNEWQPVLDAEVKRWSALSAAQLISELQDMKVYEIVFESKKYTVEVEVLENTPEYVNVAVTVDDGTLPASIFPLSYNIVRKKEDPQG
jgi:7,8-dihydro-6-hydroxymethylpterin-pyrophosphokinase